MSMVRFTPAFDVDSAFDDLVRRSLGSAATWSPAADIHLEGPDAVITLEVPGVSAGDVELEVKERSLIVRGKRRSASIASASASGTMCWRSSTGIRRTFWRPIPSTAMERWMV